MSSFYNVNRARNLFNPGSLAPYRLSRSKIDLFLECPRCFYLDRRFGIGRPPSFPFNLNIAVDTLLKKEFDVHRAAGTQHPLMRAYRVDAVPFVHEKMNEWRDALRGGVQYLHEPTRFLVTGGIDDIWVNPQGELLVVDYKATAKTGEVNLDAEWQDGYKRQVEIYQWLLRRNGFRVNDTAYFVYCNGDADKEAFDGKLEFSVTVLPYIGSDAWIEKTLADARACLMGDAVPSASLKCDFCAYRRAAFSAENQEK